MTLPGPPFYDLPKVARGTFGASRSVLRIPAIVSHLGQQMGAMHRAAIAGYTRQSHYIDNPSAGGAFSQSYPVDLFGLAEIGHLGSIEARIEYPAASGEQALVRFWRYRKTSPSTGFAYKQITNNFYVNDQTDWSWTNDMSQYIRAGSAYDLNPETDSLALTITYTPGASPSMRALRIDFYLEEA